MKKVHHVSNLYFIPEQAALANWLCENSCADKAFFCNSGAEANEAAIKLARRFAYNRGISVRVFCVCNGPLDFYENLFFVVTVRISADANDEEILQLISFLCPRCRQ